jgi:catechol 2,3-dioxygenase-like lactoylglutathione lyase family enzyme
MLYHAIDSVWVACADLHAATRPYRRLGLVLSPLGEGRLGLLVGEGAARFRLEFVAGAVPQAPESGQPFVAVVLRVGSVRDAVAELAGSGVQATLAGPLALLGMREKAGTDLALVEGAPASDAPVHGLPLARLDHLAVVAHDLEATCRFWEETLGVPVAGEVTTPALVIRQLRIGAAVLELLGPASADSPLHQRPAGLVGMVSWEVKALDEAVQRAVTAGFTPSPAAPGPLPGTRISTIPASEMAGVNMQLLQYV